MTNILYLTDIEKLKKYIVNNESLPSNIRLSQDNPIDLLILMVCKDDMITNINAQLFDETLTHLYGYFIIALHRLIFEKGGKYVNKLISIIERLKPSYSDYNTLFDFYKDLYYMLIENRLNYEEGVLKLYEKYKRVNEPIKNIIEVIFAYLGYTEIDINNLKIEHSRYVNLNDPEINTDELIDKFGYIPTFDDLNNEGDILSFYKKWLDMIKSDIIHLQKRKIIEQFLLNILNKLKKIKIIYIIDGIVVSIGSIINAIKYYYQQSLDNSIILIVILIVIITIIDRAKPFISNKEERLWVYIDKKLKAKLVRKNKKFLKLITSMKS